MHRVHADVGLQIRINLHSVQSQFPIRAVVAPSFPGMHGADDRAAFGGAIPVIPAVPIQNLVEHFTGPSQITAIPTFDQL